MAPLAQIDDPLRGLVVAFRDVTDRRRAENELVRSQRLESLGVLAGGLAHDFNNLLTIILGNLSLVEMNDGLMGDDQERLAQVRQATERAQGLTRQLLTFSRGGAPQRRHTRLQDLIEPTVALSLSGTKVNWTCDLADDLWTADIDPGQIEQVLSNLLINAGQAMPDGGTVCVRARNRELPDDAGDATRYAVIEIQDHGCGISADDRERIFEPYFTTKDTGSGLGLAIAFSIVKRHGGRLDVVSEPGRGSIFSLALPATVGEPVRILPEAAARLATGGRILVLDDDEQIRNVVEAMLKRMGFEAALTSDGHQTVAAFAAAVEASDPFRAVIVDLTIPGGMGGEEVLPELRRIDSSVPVIVASGYSHSGVMAAYRDHGFNGCLAKPYDNLQLARVLADVLPDEPARLDQA